MPLRLKVITGVLIYLLLMLAIFYAAIGNSLLSAGFGLVFLYLLGLYIVVLIDR